MEPVLTDRRSATHAGSSVSSPASLGEYIDAFETVRRKEEISDLRAYAPPRNSANHLEILCELVRVDLEYQWCGGRRVSLDFYKTRYPELFAHQEWIHRLQCEWQRQVEHFATKGTAASVSLRPETPCASLPFYPVQHGTRAKLPGPGETFLDFTLIAELGSGAFAKTYLAQQSSLANRPVVLKLTTVEFDEPRTLARLQHTNIVPLYSTHRHNGLSAICMPYCGATTFADILGGIHSSGALPRAGEFLISTLKSRHTVIMDGIGHCNANSEGVAATDAWSAELDAKHMAYPERLLDSNYVQAVLWIFAQLAQGLAHAHQRGVLHEDIKPANLLLSDDGQPMLIDFNLARRIQQGDAGSKEALGGTLPYMAPEKLRRFQDGVTPVDERSDIYSLGLVLYELLGGTRVAPSAATLAEHVAYWQAACERPVQQLAGQGPGLTPAVDAILAKCLATRLEGRYQSAAQLSVDLERHLSDLPLRHTREPSFWELQQKWTRRHPRLASAAWVATLAATLLLSVGLIATQLRSELKVATQEVSVARVQSWYQQWLATKEQIELDLALDMDGLQANQNAAAAASQAIKLWENQRDDPTLQPAIDRAFSATQRQEQNRQLAELCVLAAICQLTLARHETHPEERSQKTAAAATFVQKAQGLYTEARPEALKWLEQSLHATKSSLASPTLAPEALPSGASAMDLGLMARILAREGSIGEAIPLLEQAARLEPDRFSHWLALGGAYHQQGRQPDAVNAFSVCVALRPDLSRGFFLRGLAYQKMGAWPQSLADYQEALAKNPKDPHAQLRAATVLLEQGANQEAIERLTELIERGDLKCWALLMRKRAYANLGRYELAERDHQSALKQPPADEMSWILLGLDHIETDPQAALHCFAQALALNPSSREALQNQAHVLSEQGDVPAAIKVLDRLIAIDSSYIPALGGRAVLHARLKKGEAARADATRCLKLDRNPFTLYQLAGAYAQLGQDHADDRRQAIELAAIALQADPGLVTLVDSDPDIAPLRGDEFFERLVKHARASQRN